MFWFHLAWKVIRIVTFLSIPLFILLLLFLLLTFSQISCNPHLTPPVVSLSTVFDIEYKKRYYRTHNLFPQMPFFTCMKSLKPLLYLLQWGLRVFSLWSGCLLTSFLFNRAAAQEKVIKQFIFFLTYFASKW